MCGCGGGIRCTRSRTPSPAHVVLLKLCLLTAKCLGSIIICFSRKEWRGGWISFCSSHHTVHPLLSLVTLSLLSSSSSHLLAVTYTLHTTYSFRLGIYSM
ncbi:hypothetical protein B0H14DRAFT_2870105, partial [Mycena olivaceomarginata]